jgi:hypothetical protein
MRKFWAIVVITAVVVGVFFLIHPKNHLSENPPAQNGAVPEASSNLPAAQSRSQNTPSVPPTDANPKPTTDLASRAASPTLTPGSTSSTNEELLPPLTILDKARVIMHNYRAAFGENPTGTNPEITTALIGKNAKQINFVAESGLRVNENGEMVDSYGTPFFFHQISGQEMEIRSAGQDKIMWTGDDLVTR